MKRSVLLTVTVLTVTGGAVLVSVNPAFAKTTTTTPTTVPRTISPASTLTPSTLAPAGPSGSGYVVAPSRDQVLVDTAVGYVRQRCVLHEANGFFLDSFLARWLTGDIVSETRSKLVSDLRATSARLGIGAWYRVTPIAYRITNLDGPSRVLVEVWFVNAQGSSNGSVTETSFQTFTAELVNRNGQWRISSLADTLNSKVLVQPAGGPDREAFTALIDPSTKTLAKPSKG
jgi:hypothetical protein